MITVKEKLTDLPTVLNSSDGKTHANYMFKLGKLIKELETKTGEMVKFNKFEYDSYLFPRILELTCIDKIKKEFLIYKVGLISSKFENKQIISSVVTDLNLGNLHLNENDEFVLLDMGDAYRGDCYGNIVTIYHSIKYGPLQGYFENKRKTEKLFNCFLDGHGSHDLNIDEFNLFQIKSLVCMLLFVEKLKTANRSPIRKILSILSNRMLIQKLYNHIVKLLEVPSE